MVKDFNYIHGHKKILQVSVYVSCNIFSIYHVQICVFWFTVQKGLPTQGHINLTMQSEIVGVLN